MFTESLLADREFLLEVIEALFEDKEIHSREEILKRIEKLKEVEWIYEDLSK